MSDKRPTLTQYEHITVWHLGGETSRFHDVEVKVATTEELTFTYASSSDGLRKAATINRAQISILSVYQGKHAE